MLIEHGANVNHRDKVHKRRVNINQYVIHIITDIHIELETKLHATFM